MAWVFVTALLLSTAKRVDGEVIDEPMDRSFIEVQ